MQLVGSWLHFYQELKLLQIMLEVTSYKYCVNSA